MSRSRSAGRSAIVAFIGLDGASAAAQVLLLHPHAELHVASQRSVGKRLAALVGQGFGEVYLCGVGLSCPLDEVLEPLQALKAARCRVVWFACADHLDMHREALEQVCQLETIAQAPNPAEALFESLGKQATDLERARLIRYIGTQYDSEDKLPARDRSLWSVVAELKDLVHGSYWRYFNYLDEAAYPHAIGVLAGMETMDDKDQRTIAAYRREGRRYLKGRSPAMEAVKRQAALYARAHSSVVVLGETGTGKEIVARLLHEESPRSGHPFHATNCATLRGDLLQDTLFGHVKGAFTGADRDMAGVFELADGGTVFLDEISEMPMEAQSMLLRLIQEGTYQRLGERKDRHTDVRIIAATQHDLLARAQEGRFRADLYYRLAVLTITIPPLRARVEDIPDLASHILYQLSEEHGASRVRLTPRQIADLRAHPWPGNVRELENVLERFFVTREKDMRKLLDPTPMPVAATMEILPLSEHESRYIRAVLDRFEGNLTHAARALGITRNTLKARLRGGAVK
ncbi:sigma-54-dependent Fis family transcriptional regulator [bacterium]|nr:sigma-54-dependent Fis family transcriptional regulator [bacterium]